MALAPTSSRGLGGATVATTVAGLGTGAAGAVGLIRVGTTPYDFLGLVYDATLAAWVSQAAVITSSNGGGSSASYTDFSPLGRIPEPWRLWDTAGLKPQFRTTLVSSTDGTHAVFVAAIVDVADDAATPALVTSANFAESTTATTSRMTQSGWTDIPVLTVKDYIAGRLQWKQAQAGSGTIAGAALARRWISK